MRPFFAFVLLSVLSGCHAVDRANLECASLFSGDFLMQKDCNLGVRIAYREAANISLQDANPENAAEFRQAAIQSCLDEVDSYRASEGFADVPNELACRAGVDAFIHSLAP
jgi:hypothetical protein